MSKRATFALAAVLGLTAASAAEAQLGLSNVLESRLGKDPSDPLPGTSKNRFTNFDQLNLEYWSDPIRLGFRYETYVPSDDAALETHVFSRRWVEWSSEHLAALAGNYEAIFGRGLVLRAFELPGVIREEFGTPQFSDSRDLDGVRLRVHGPRFELMALQGKPRRADEPPTARRLGNLEGATAGLRLLPGVRAGGEYLRLDRQDGDPLQPATFVEVPGAFVQVGLQPWLDRAGIRHVSLDTYVEHARAHGLLLPPAIGSTRSSPSQGYAYYFSQALSIEDLVPELRWGLSYEYKDYQNFELGVNEPPTLVREHSYALLNRSTHVLAPLQEEGYQLESRLDYRRLADLTLNWSRAENHPLPTDPAGFDTAARFREFYAELAGHARGGTLSLFADRAQDGIAGVERRRVYGTYTMLPVTRVHSFEIEYELLTALRDLRRFGKVDFKDSHFSATWSWAGKVSLGAVHQTTDDPDEVTARRPYDSLTGRVTLGEHQDLEVFWGHRRGGLACVAGTCYKVRAFDGVLVDLRSRF